MKVNSSVKIAIAAATLMVMLGGCGSNREAAEEQTSAATVSLGADTEGRAYVGADKCISCHAGFSWSIEAVADYLEGKHVVHSDHVNASLVADGCLGCHDPIGDGTTIEGLIDPENVPEGGLAAVTCEACHGAGGQHYGVGPMPTPIPDYNTCGECHNAAFSHNAYHPEADNIVEDYQESKHFTASVRNEAICAKCHTDAGARLYRNITTRDALMAHVLPVENSDPIQCRTCHNAHNPMELLLPEVEDHGDVEASAEYATCTTCHQSDEAMVALDAEGETDWDNTDLIYHEDRYYRLITDTHSDDPATPDFIEGYALDPKNERVCRDCHNVHAVQEIRADRDTNTINDQWANSAHAGHIGQAKAAKAQEYADMDLGQTAEQTIAIKAAGVDGGDSPWPHYDWDAANRQDCQRCHTATGVMNFLDATATMNDDNADNDVAYDPENNDFSHLEGWQAATATTDLVSSGQNELLYCWGCHKNNSGELRAPGPITADYTDAPHTFPDVAGSNICLACHTGRESGETIKNSTADFSNKSFINSHYLSAGGQVFAATGYEYAGRSYENPFSYMHDRLGMGTTGVAAIDDNYTNGPCITCHFSSNDGSHTLSPLTQYSANDLSLNPVCLNCHGTHGEGTNSGVEWLEDRWKARYNDSIAALEAQLAVAGIPFLGGYPYFSPTDNNWLSAGDTDTTGATTGKNNMGAAFNFNLLAHDPGGFAHNRYYTRRLIYDAIDWLDNNVMDYSVGATLEALDASATYKDNAFVYLIKDELATGDERERW